jgi:hypothetical protein
MLIRRVELGVPPRNRDSKRNQVRYDRGAAPRCVTMDTVEHVSQNPFDPLYGDTSAKACRSVGLVRFRV